MRQRITRWLSLVMVCFMLSVYGTTAQAALQAVGPLDAVNGFPTWYRDATTVALQPCLSLTLLASGNQGCVLPAQPPFYDGTPAIAFPTNYPFEVFYFIADSNATTILPAPTALTPLAGFTYRAALEATFSTPTVVTGGQITFARIRMRMDVTKAGTYTITHPYGVETFTVTAAQLGIGNKGINMTRDIGLAPFPTGPLAGDIGPYLTQVGFPTTVVATGETFIGDFNIPAPVTGSPNGTNFIKIVGPVGANLDGAGSTTFTTNLFAVSGKVFTGQIPSPLTIDRATYARDAASSQVDVFATALPAAIPNISGTGILNTNLTQDFPNSGKFFTHFSLATSVLPASLNITNNLDVPPILHPVTLVDEVNITLANYNPVSKVLTIKAASRDKLNPLPTLSIPALAAPNTLDATGTLSKTLAANTIPPMTVTVSSSNGGSATVPVSVVTPPALPVAVADTATTVGTTPVVINVIANDSAAGIIDPATVVTASPINGTAVASTNGTVTFTPAAPTVATVYPVAASFTYTVQDTFGQISNPVTVSVTVTAPVSVTPPVVTPTAPLATADTATTAAGTAVKIFVLNNDIAGAASTLVPASVLVTPIPANGTAVANPVDGSVTFTPAVGFISGSIAFSYTVANSSALTSAPVNVTVNLIANIPPVANPDAASTFVNTARIINVKANDTDVDGTIAAGPVTIVGVPTNGTATPNADGTVTFTPTAGFAGTGTFSYNVVDNAGATSNNALVTVTIAAPVTDAVTVLKAEYNTAGSQWLVEGTTTNLSTASRIVTIYLGSNLTGQIIGTIADVGGKWKFQTSASGVVANATNRIISVALPSGASRLAFPVVVK